MSTPKNFEFTIELNKLKTVDNYKYFGNDIHLFRKFLKNGEMLANKEKKGGALWKIISSIQDFGFNSYEKLFYSCFIPVIDYPSSVWVFKNF